MTRQIDGPVVAVVLAGPAGVGKTTLATVLARHLGAALLDLDTLTAPLVQVVAELVGSDDLDGTRLQRATRTARYQALIATAQDSLNCATPVVLVAPFTSERRDPAAWAHLEQSLSDAGGEARLVWVHAPRAVLRQRLLERAAARDAAKLRDIEAHLDRLDLSAPVVAHTPVNTAAPLDVAALADQLQSSPQR